MKIRDREIGSNQPPYIIAELSANHLGDFDRAMKILEVSAEAGADAVKLQTYTADTITIDHDGPGFTIEGGLWDGRNLYELYQEAYTPWEWHEPLMARGRELGVDVFSSPFDPTAVDFLDALDVPAIKIASFECVDLPLIRYAAKTNRPLIMSTGMATLGEIDAAVNAARDSGSGGVVLLHCISGYPTPAADSNLRTIPHMATAFDCAVGLSDHTMGTAVSVAAIAMGACVIEKHVTLARADGGPDGAFSLEPDELKRLVEDTRTAWEALGTVGYSLKGSESGNATMRRSLYAVVDIAAGERLTAENCRSIRPGHGLPAKELPSVLGMRARTDLAKGTPIAWSLLEE